MALPEGLLEKVQAAYPNLTNSEKLIARYLIDAPEEFALSSARRTADAVGVSEASVTRFAYALGFSGFSQLRERLQKELMQRSNRGFKDLLDASYRSATGNAPHLFDFLREDMELLERSMRKLSLDAFERAVQAILQADTITVAGSRRARGLAVILAITLNNIRGNTQLASMYSGELADEIQRLRPDGLLIAFAFARYVRETVLMVRLAAQKGVPTIVITDSPLSPPAQPAHIVLTVETQHRAHRLSYVAALSVANALASTVAYRSWEHSARYASASEELFRDTETFWSRL
ncbi:MAG TPA: MurR/RpiR family transcriptional regulator [Limnochordales bacterium]|nr:MurR/RpiR family transcriptional regulator [Limnochordales bacterium]